MKSWSFLSRVVMGAAVVVASGTATAAPQTYTIDPAHTYPSFEADHMGGLSTWRGKFNATSGTVTIDKAAGTGTLDVKIDAASIDFGHEKMNEHAKSKDMFDVAQFPAANYAGKLVKFKDGAPTEVEGSLTLHGVTKPVTLKIEKFLCKDVRGKNVCGADATAKINREEFGISMGKQFGFNMDVMLRIQVEAGLGS